MDTVLRPPGNQHSINIKIVALCILCPTKWLTRITVIVHAWKFLNEKGHMQKYGHGPRIIIHSPLLTD
jgi:hypothetical protein